MRTPNRSDFIDLLALIVIVSASVILVVCGNVSASTIIIVGEFVAGILFAWFRLDVRNPRGDEKLAEPSLVRVPEVAACDEQRADDTTSEVASA
ncbi:hypothetical protein [Streptomyces hokutonensis]|uniref:hypothetical protein n=1 Tax=Streptomyces hokutonensis TaxID=1306990 RepID=UPI00036F6E69|nr:hypothetical protein [Streptomyces hokutonensis]